MIINVVLGNIYYKAHEFDQAIDQERRVLELFPASDRAYFTLIESLVEKKMFPEAITELENLILKSRILLKRYGAHSLKTAREESGRKC
jgi:tetratricopeptide (TPR) repeat protein